MHLLANLHSLQEVTLKKACNCTRCALASSRALHELGCYYSDSYGVPLNKQKAIEYYTKASNLGVLDAQNDLGWIYVTGDGIEQDIQKGKDCLLLKVTVMLNII